MNIYSDFKPTYLYIKQHSITGKFYFGKTTKLNPEIYLGSGKYWKRHINTHGKEYVITLWYCLFYTQESCIEFAVSFSKQENIVESANWLNLKYENGIDGGSDKGILKTDEHKAKTSKSMIGVKYSKERVAKITSSKRLTNSFNSERATLQLKNARMNANFNKTWKILTPNNGIIFTRDLPKFCKDNNILYNSLQTSFYRKIPISRGNSKGYQLISNELQE